jgi:hypothetical protein
MCRDRKFKQYVDLYAKDEDTFFKVGLTGGGGSGTPEFVLGGWGSTMHCQTDTGV